jgi:hypothetical protein
MELNVLGIIAIGLFVAATFVFFFVGKTANKASDQLEEVDGEIAFDLPPKPLEDMTKAELLEVADECNIAGVRSRMRKAEVFELVRRNFGV